MTSVTDVVVIGGGQSGLAAARALQTQGISPVVLEAEPEPAGSWPRYYDSLALFSPARYSGMPGLDFPGDPDHYPHRDEVARYLRRYAASLGADIRTSTPVSAVEADDRGGFVVRTGTGQSVHAAGVVAATGSFGNPYMPALPGQDRFSGRLLHVAGYRSPHQHGGERVVVVGAGNSAVQVGYELAQVATVTLATRHPVTFHPQRRGGRDLHYWLVSSGFDLLPPQWLSHYLGDRWVVDTGRYRHALESGQLDRRPMFTGFGIDGVVWPDGTRRRGWTPWFSPPATAPTWATSARWAPSTPRGCRCTPVASRPPIPAWSTSGWSSSARSPPTPCAACTATPGTSITPLAAHVRKPRLLLACDSKWTQPGPAALSQASLPQAEVRPLGSACGQACQGVRRSLPGAVRGVRRGG